MFKKNDSQQIHFLKFIFCQSIIIILTAFISCKDSKKNFDGSAKNFVALNIDTNCINAGGNAYIELYSKNFDTVIKAITHKLQAVMGPDVFGKDQILNLQDSMRSRIFDLDSSFILGDIQIDTTNMLSFKDNASYYLSDSLTPQKNPSWKYVLTRKNFFTYQEVSNVEVMCEFYPCIEKVIKRVGKFKRHRKGKSMPDDSHGSILYRDEINIYECIINLSIQILIRDKFMLAASNHEYYQLTLTDTGKVFTIREIE